MVQSHKKGPFDETVEDLAEGESHASALELLDFPSSALWSMRYHFASDFVPPQAVDIK